MMYDDLVKRLRAQADAERYFVGEDMLYDKAADAIEELQQKVEHYHGCMNDWFEAAQEYKAQIPRWIPVSERLPETGVDVLVKFPQNMAVASIDIGEWVVNSGDGWCTDINLAGGEKNPTHWMPLPQGPEEEWA